MPELPEVETVRRVLGPLCAGRKIERVSVRRPEVIAHPGAEEFCSRLAGGRSPAWGDGGNSSAYCWRTAGARRCTCG